MNIEILQVKHTERKIMQIYLDKSISRRSSKKVILPDKLKNLFVCS